MGCVVNGPGESKHANIGISLPGTFEEPKAPVYVDGRLMVTLKGDAIVPEFLAHPRATTSRRATGVSRSMVVTRSPTLHDQPLTAAAGLAVRRRPGDQPHSLRLPDDSHHQRDSRRRGAGGRSRGRTVAMTLLYVGGLALVYSLLGPRWPASPGPSSARSARIRGPTSSWPTCCWCSVWPCWTSLRVNAPERLSAWAGADGGRLAGRRLPRWAPPRGSWPRPAGRRRSPRCSPSSPGPAAPALGFLYLLVFSLGLTALLVAVGLFSGARGAAAGGPLDPAGSSGPAACCCWRWPSTISCRDGECAVRAHRGCALSRRRCSAGRRPTRWRRRTGSRSAPRAPAVAVHDLDGKPVDLGPVHRQETGAARILGHLVRALRGATARGCAPPRRSSATGSNSSA